MRTVENGMVSGLERHYAAQGRREDADTAAYVSLRDALIEALGSGTDAQVPTPGSMAGGTAAASEIFCAALTNSRRGDEILNETIKVISLAARGMFGTELHMVSKALVAKVAADYADFHSGDLADEMMEGDD